MSAVDVLLARATRLQPDGTETVRVRGEDISPSSATHPGPGGVLRWTVERGPAGDVAGCPDCAALDLRDDVAGHVPGSMTCGSCGSEFLAGSEAAS